MIDGPEILERIHIGAGEAVVRGRLPVSVFLGGDSFTTMARWITFTRQAHHGSSGAIMLWTAFGPLRVTVRDSLHEAVIVEDSMGEPYMVTSSV